MNGVYIHDLPPTDLHCKGKTRKVEDQPIVFMRRNFTSRGQESGSALGAAVCKIHASKHCIESLLSVLKE